MVNTFPDPVGHFGAPWRPFWGPRAAILDLWCSHRRNGRIKKLIQQKLIGGSNNLRFNLFPNPVGHFGLSRRLGHPLTTGVAGGERVPPAPLGWYFYPHPPTNPRDSSIVTLLDFLGRWNLVSKLYSTKLKGEQKKTYQIFFTITRSKFTQILKSWTFLNSSSSWLLKNVQDHWIWAKFDRDMAKMK